MRITPNDNACDPWASWLEAKAVAQGLADVQGIAAACGIPAPQLLAWGAVVQPVRPAVSEVLQVSALLKVDPYDLLVASGWVNSIVNSRVNSEAPGQALTREPSVQIDGEVTSITWPEEDPPPVS